MRTIVSLALLLSFGVLPSFTLAQFREEPLARPIELKVEPAFPAPNSSATVRISSYTIDIERSNVSWYINGSLVSEGAGISEISVPVGGANSRTTVRVQAIEENGLLAQGTIFITPTLMSIVWESDAYVPPFFTGRKLPGASSKIHAQVVHTIARNGTRVPDRDIIFKWYRNNSPISSISGRGKSSVTFEGPSLFATETLSVRAETLDGTIQSATQTILPSIDPFLELYERHPLFGILFHRPISSIDIKETEMDFTAVPFFARTLAPYDRTLIYEWKVNGTDIPADPNEPQNLKITNSGYQGPGSIGLSISSEKEWTLSAKRVWDIYFGSQNRNESLRGASPFGDGQ